MYLTKEEKRMLKGEEGGAVKLAMEILTEVGEIYGAKRLIEVESAHIVLAMYKSIYDAGVEVCERFAELGAKFRVPTTLDPCGMDIERWRDFKVPESYAEKQFRVIRAYEKMGAIPTWTCIPYLEGNLPRFGQHIAWTESSAVAFINSVIGARTNRETAVVDVSAGITGRIPEFGLHLAENRRGEILIEIKLKPNSLTSADYPILGYFLGKEAGSEIPVVSGLEKMNPAIEDLKAMCAAAAASGSVALCHLVGITPEANSLNAAFQGKGPKRRITFGKREMEKTREEMSTVKSGSVDLVAVGCPHYTISEIKRVVDLLQGRKVKDGIQFWIYTTKHIQTLATSLGYAQVLKNSGVEITAGTCMLISPVEEWGFKTIMTDSGKCAYYAPMQCKAQVIYGSLEECVEAALRGEYRGRAKV